MKMLFNQIGELKMNNEGIKDQILEQTKELEILLNDRISELYELSGSTQGHPIQGLRHAFIYYRDFAWKIRDLAREIKK